MTAEQWVAYGAFAISVISMIYATTVHTPKEVQGQINGMRVDNAEIKRDLANLIKTVDRLAELVYARETHNGRANR